MPFSRSWLHRRRPLPGRLRALCPHQLSSQRQQQIRFLLLRPGRDCCPNSSSSSRRKSSRWQLRCPQPLRQRPAAAGVRKAD